MEILNFKGPLSDLIYILKKGGSIHIKKKNRGKFTESAKRAGMGVQEYARHVLANKDEYSSTLVKRANFARNAKKFKHEDGGVLKYQNPAESLPESKDTLNTNYLIFKETLPKNLRLTPEKDYHMYDYWKLSGEPKNFREGKRKGMFGWDWSDWRWHAGSIAEDRNTGIYHFMKPKHHPTVKYELDWFTKGLKTLEGGEQVPVEGKDKKFWEDFTSKYQLDSTGVDYRYVPIKK